MPGDFEGSRGTPESVAGKEAEPLALDEESTRILDTLAPAQRTWVADCLARQDDVKDIHAEVRGYAEAIPHIEGIIEKFLAIGEEGAIVFHDVIGDAERLYSKAAAIIPATDLSLYPRYTEAVREAFRTMSRHADTDIVTSLIRIRDKFGAGVEVSDLAKDRFIRQLEAGSAHRLSAVRLLDIFDADRQWGKDKDARSAALIAFDEWGVGKDEDAALTLLEHFSSPGSFLSHQRDPRRVRQTFLFLRDLRKRAPEAAQRLQDAMAQDPFWHSMNRLTKVQGFAARAEYDPWIKFGGMLEDAYRKFIEQDTAQKTPSATLLELPKYSNAPRPLTQEQQEQMDRAQRDAELVYEFVQKYGMHDTPELFRLFVHIQRAKTCEDIPPEVVESLKKFSPRLDPARHKDPASVENAIRQEIRVFEDALLHDQLPRQLREPNIGYAQRPGGNRFENDMPVLEGVHPIGLELVDRMRGVSEWGEHDDRSMNELLAEWRLTVRTALRENLLPYLAYADPAGDRETSPMPFEQAVQDPVIQEFIEYFQAVQEHNPSARIRNIAEAWINETAVLPEIARVPEGYEVASYEIPVQKRTKASADARERMKAVLSDAAVSGAVEQWHTALHFAVLKQDMPFSEWWRRVFHRQIGKAVPHLKRSGGTEAKSAYDDIRTELDRIASDTSTNIRYEDLLEQLCRIDTDHESLDLVIRMLALRHMHEVAPPGFRPFIRNVPGEKDAQFIKHTAHFIRQYLAEHYLHADQEEHKTSHRPFSPQTVVRIQKLFGLDETIENNPIVQAAGEIRKIQAEASTVDVSKTQKITYVPVRGFARVLAGDFADACYTSQHQVLAKGEYPQLNGVLMVKNYGRPTQSVVGSTLFIETTTPDGTPALLVRANNPQENLVKELSSRHLVHSTFDYAKRVAQGRMRAVGEDQQRTLIVAPRDRAAESSTNREDIAGVYDEILQDAPLTALTQQPETEFNGYENWNPDGRNPCVLVEEVAA